MGRIGLAQIWEVSKICLLFGIRHKDWILLFLSKSGSTDPLLSKKVNAQYHTSMSRKLLVQYTLTCRTNHSCKSLGCMVLRSGGPHLCYHSSPHPHHDYDHVMM